MHIQDLIDRWKREHIIFNTSSAKPIEDLLIVSASVLGQVLMSPLTQSPQHMSPQKNNSSDSVGDTAPPPVTPSPPVSTYTRPVYVISNSEYLDHRDLFPSSVAYARWRSNQVYKLHSLSSVSV